MKVSYEDFDYSMSYIILTEDRVIKISRFKPLALFAKI